MNYFFEVNRRLVYAIVMRSADNDCSASPYASHNKALLKAAKKFVMK
jgi:hypothetical protein